jgi:hypothetical protein
MLTIRLTRQLRWHRWMNTLPRHNNTLYLSLLCMFISLAYILYSFWLLIKIKQTKNLAYISSSLMFAPQPHVRKHKNNYGLCLPARLTLRKLWKAHGHSMYACIITVSTWWSCMPAIKFNIITNCTATKNVDLYTLKSLEVYIAFCGIYCIIIMEKWLVFLTVYS